MRQNVQRIALLAMLIVLLPFSHALGQPRGDKFGKRPGDGFGQGSFRSVENLSGGGVIGGHADHSMPQPGCNSCTRTVNARSLGVNSDALLPNASLETKSPQIETPKTPAVVTAKGNEAADEKAQVTEVAKENVEQVEKIWWVWGALGLGAVLYTAAIVWRKSRKKRIDP
jgi:hypothetical protein